MEKLIISQNTHWKKEYKGLYNRDIVTKIINRLDMPHIEALQGIRRSGKSTIFKLIINYLSKSIDPKKILFVNLDDPYFIPFGSDATKFYNIIEIAEKLTQRKIEYLFLDEVQSINGWERFVKSAYDTQSFKKIFITGSNASFLDGKLATLLTGRYLSSLVYPFSYKELLEIAGINSYIKLIEKRSLVLNLVDNILQNGSFIEVFNAKNENKRDLIKSYYDAIILKDCISNNQVRDTKNFRELSFYLLNNITSIFSYNKISKAIGISDLSAKEYINYLQESFIMQELKQYSFSVKEQISSKKKIYTIDNGFMLLNFKFSSNFGKLLENLVYSELVKNGYEVYFYNKDFECDFIAIKDNYKIALQVAYELNEDNLKRELNGLKKLPFNVDKKYIITYNQEESLKDNIKAVSFWKFFYEI